MASQDDYVAHFHNYFRLVGVVVSGPQRIEADSDKKLARTEFILSVKRAGTSVNYIPVMCLGKQAEVATIKAQKLNKIAVEGMIITKLIKQRNKAASFAMYLIASDIYVLEKIKKIDITKKQDYFKDVYQKTSLSEFSLKPPGVFRIPPARKIKKPFAYQAKKGALKK